jgi:hypothetical protein
MAPPTNPTIDQKVTTENAPSTYTSAHHHGAIDSSSLAADSIRSGGDFASNPGASPGSGPASNPRAAAPGTADSTHSGLDSQESYGGKAPGYATHTQYNQTPHGRNLTEGGFAGSGTGGGRLPEPGSKDDPAREAVKGLIGSRHAPTGINHKKEGVLSNEQPFKALGGDASA